MDNVLSFLTSLDDNEINNMLVFLKNYVDSRTKQKTIDTRLKRLEAILKLQGSSNTQIEHSKICKLRSLGEIDKEEERRRITGLYTE